MELNIINEAIEQFDRGSQIQLYRAVSRYILIREEPEFRGDLKAFWLVIKPQINSALKITTLISAQENLKRK